VERAAKTSIRLKRAGGSIISWHASKRDGIRMLWLLGKPSCALCSTVLISSSAHQNWQ
jgi:hypothetical protein